MRPRKAGDPNGIRLPFDRRFGQGSRTRDLHSRLAPGQEEGDREPRDVSSSEKFLSQSDADHFRILQKLHLFARNCNEQYSVGCNRSLVIGRSSWAIESAGIAAAKMKPPTGDCLGLTRSSNSANSCPLPVTGQTWLRGDSRGLEGRGGWSNRGAKSPSRWVCQGGRSSKRVQGPEGTGTPQYCRSQCH